MTRMNTRLFIFMCTVLLCSCASSKKVLYFQDIGQNKNLEALRDYEPAIRKDDQLSILVSGPNKEVVVPYNLSGDNSSGGGGIAYHVDLDGYINFPVLGQIRAEGLTRRELAAKLTEEIAKDVKNPIVNISFLNYRITILGEVHSPGTYTLPSEKTTILQALGMAGDLAITAKRKNILLIREADGKYEYARIDLRKTDVFSSPYYYLSQNDVIYVSPVSSRIAGATSPMAVFSLVTSSISLILTIALLVL